MYSTSMDDWNCNGEVKQKKCNNSIQGTLIFVAFWDWMKMLETDMKIQSIKVRLVKSIALDKKKRELVEFAQNQVSQEPLEAYKSIQNQGQVALLYQICQGSDVRQSKTPNLTPAQNI